MSIQKYRLSHKIRIGNLSQLGWAGQAKKDSRGRFYGTACNFQVVFSAKKVDVFLCFNTCLYIDILKFPEKAELKDIAAGKAGRAGVVRCAVRADLSVR